MNLELWSQLEPELREIVATACAAEASYARAETEWRNAEALNVLEREHGVEIRRFPPDLIAAARETTREVMAEFAEGSSVERRILSSYETARQSAQRWSEISTAALLQARA